MPAIPTCEHLTRNHKLINCCACCASVEKSIPDVYALPSLYKKSLGKSLPKIQIIASSTNRSQSSCLELKAGPFIICKLYEKSYIRIWVNHECYRVCLRWPNRWKTALGRLWYHCGRKIKPSNISMLCPIGFNWIITSIRVFLLLALLFYLEKYYHKSPAVVVRYSS